ncbi:MAG TPA: J domain-containing protein [Rhodoferax sp.]
MTSFYETLEVSPRASHIVIRAAYRCLAQSDHPDKNSDSEDAGQRMSRINRAYAVLSDHEKRHEYDMSQGISRDFCERRGFGALSPAQRQSPGKGPPTDRPFAFRPLV